MKLLIIALSLFTTVLAKTGYANETVITPVVLNNFQNSFADANNVSWSEVNGMYKARFYVNKQFITGYYNVDGDLVAMIKNISTSELPKSLQASLRNSIGQFWITDLFEIINEDGKSYYITLENADSQVVLKSESNKKWSVYKKGVKI